MAAPAPYSRGAYSYWREGIEGGPGALPQEFFFNFVQFHKFLSELYTKVIILNI